MKHLIAASVLILTCAPSLPAQAQPVLPSIDPPRAGDCALTIRVPAGTDPKAVSITLNSTAAPLRFTVLQRVPLLAGLKQPLVQNDDVTVKLGAVSVTARVAAGDSQTAAAPCSSRKERSTVSSDDREVFETSGFLGEVFDNFAPNIAGGYAGPASPSDTHSRVTAGIESQYRLAGGQNDVRQLWIAGHTLHGMRSADASCSDTPSNADCIAQQAKNPGAQFNYILEHASTIEAHVDLRLELLRIQGESQVPAKFYVYGRAGFLDLEAAPRVYDSDSVGVGIIAPKGVFRDSYAQVGLGVSKQFQTDHTFDRLKINGVLVFDVMPGVSTSSLWGKVGSGTRFFLSIAIDRNPLRGPDSVQTYIGADFDLRRIFGSF